MFKNRKGLKRISIVIAAVIVLSMVLATVAPYMF